MFRNPEKSAIIILVIGVSTYVLAMLISMILNKIEMSKRSIPQGDAYPRRRFSTFLTKNRVRLTHYFYFVFIILITEFGSFKKSLMICGLIVSAMGGFFRAWAIRYKLDKTVLIKDGPYRYVRHPRYLGNFLIGLGITVLSSNAIIVFFFVMCFFTVYYAKIKEEEKALAERYGNEFIEYKREVGTVVPFYRMLKTKKELSSEYKEKSILKTIEAFSWGMLMNLFVCLLLYIKDYFALKLF